MTTQPIHSPAATVSPADLGVPRPLLIGERVEVWLGHTQSAPPAADTPDASPGAMDTDWYVESARVIAVVPHAAILQRTEASSGQQVQPGRLALVRRAGADGLAEWEGSVGDDDVPLYLDYGALAAYHAAPEATFVVRFAPAHASGRLYQRRRSPRLMLAETTCRVAQLGSTERPMAADRRELHEALLTDVSEHGAGMSLEAPVSGGTPVALVFSLPGEATPFSVRGRVVEPATANFGAAQGPSEASQRFRRGVEFVGMASNQESQRLAAAIDRLLATQAA